MNYGSLNRRGNFHKSYPTYVQRMVRAGQSFVSRYETELAEMTRVAEAIVNNTATKEDLTSVDAIRAKIQLTYDVGELKNLQDWLVRAEAATAGLEKSVANLAAATKTK